jgi:hypothetical protein
MAPIAPTSLAKVIQLSVAPVFLITGIFAFLGVLSQRVARVFDQLMTVVSQQASANRDQVVRLQKRRLLLVNWAFSCATLAAIMVCSVVMVLFVSAVTPVDLSLLVIPAFILAMASLIVALLCFFRVLRLSMAVVRLRLPGDF